VLFSKFLRFQLAFLILCLSLSVPLALSAQTAPSEPAPAAAAQSASPAGLRISGGDLLEVAVYGADDLKRDIRVNSAGDITLPLIGVVHVGGLPAETAEKAIADSYLKGGFVKDPQVTVLIKEFATQGISVLGEVTKPGVYPALGARRLFDMISAASGMTPKAGRAITITRRNDPDHPIELALQQDLSRSLGSNVDVYPGDTIVVSKAGIVYVVGDVTKPGGFVLENNSEHLTVLQAIALAQGVNRTAALKDAKIIRKGPSGPIEQQIDLAAIMKAKAQDQALQNDDIVFVPISATKSAAKRGLEAILQTATGLAIYRPY